MKINKNYNENEINIETAENGKSGKRMPVWLLILTDLLLTCVCLGAFTLYHYILPRHLSTEEIIVATAGAGEDNTFTLPGNITASSADENSNASSSTDTTSEANTASGETGASTDSSASGTPTVTAPASETSDTSASNSETSDTSASNSETSDSAGPTSETTTDNNKDNNKGRDSNGNITNYGNADTMDIYADQSESERFSSKDRTVTEVNSYNGENVQFTTDKVEVGSGNDKITYYVSNVFVTNVKYLKTAFAKGDYGKNIRESTLEQAGDNNATLAINGDYYGNNEIGVVIRNGILYRSEVYDADLCVLFTDGTMKTYAPGEFNLEDIIAQGAWQAWVFGPQLLDGKGNILPKFNSTYYLSLSHPRTAIGYVEPGHYVFLVIDGRDNGYSRGATLTEMAQIFVEAGCVSAYNLDGGQSSEMVYDNKFVNQPIHGGRDVSDIIYVGED